MSNTDFKEGDINATGLEHSFSLFIVCEDKQKMLCSRLLVASAVSGVHRKLNNSFNLTRW